MKRRIEHLEATLAQSHTPSSTTWPNKRRKSQPASPWSERSPQQEPVAPVSPHNKNSSPQSPTRHASTRTRSPLRQALGRSWLFKDMQLLSRKSQQWISSRTGQDNVLERFRLFEDIEDAVPRARHRPPKNTNQDRNIPEESLPRELLSKGRKFSSSFACPLPDERLWEVLLEEAYSSVPPAASVACVWALHAYMSSRSNVEEGFETVNGKHCAIKSQSLIGETLGEPSLEVLQATLFLVSPPTIYMLCQSLTHCVI